MNKKKLESLGIYFIVFQTQFNGFVKCFLDGDENYTLYTFEELINIASSIDDLNIIPKLKESLAESSFFLWDITSSTIERLSPSFANDKSTLLQMMNNQTNSVYNSNQKNLMTQKMINYEEGIISRKKVL